MALSKSTLEVLQRQGSLSDAQAREVAQHNFETGSTQFLRGSTVFSDPTHGRLDFANVETPGTIEFRLFNPERQQQAQTRLTEAQNIFKQQTGEELGTAATETILGHLRQGDTAEQALRNLGDLENFVKFGGNRPQQTGEVRLAGTTGAGGRLVGPSGMTTTDFARSFQAREGRAPTNEELIAFTKARKQGRPLEQIVSEVADQPVEVTPGRMQREEQVRLPEPRANVRDSEGFVRQANLSIGELMKQLTPPDTEVDKAQRDLLDSIANLTGDMAQRAADQLTQEQAAGLPELRQQFADINSQILSKTAEYDVLLNENRNRPVTMGSILGTARAILDAKASEVGLLQARALGLQGQIQVAQDTVNRAIDLEYQSKEAQLDVLQAQLNAIQPFLNKQERTQALAQQVLLDERSRLLDEQKREDKEIQSIMLDALNSGITDGNILQRISGAPSVESAIRIMGENMPAGARDRDTQVVTGGGKTLLIDRQTGEVIQDFGSAFKTGGGGAGVGGAGLTSSQLQRARSNFLIANPGSNVADFDALSDSDKLRWAGGGPEPEPTAIDQALNFRDDLLTLKEANFSDSEAFDIIVNEGGLMNDQEIGIFKDVFGGFFGERPGRG